MKRFTAFILFLLAPILVISLLLLFLNLYLLNNSPWGITFLAVDIRVWALGWILIVAYIWGIIQLDDYLQFKKWRRSWK